MSGLSFVNIFGDVIDLDPIPDLKDTVDEIQARIAALISIHPERISLFHGEYELEGSMQLQEALQLNVGDGGNDDSSIDGTFVVAIHPCRTRPEHYASFITLYTDEPLSVRERQPDWEPYQMEKGFVKCGHVEFPQPTEIDVNMLPFVIGNKNSLPEELHDYWSMIERCRGLEKGSICYLTVQESFVEQDESQRRPGLHTETPGLLMRTPGSTYEHHIHWGDGGHNGMGDILHDGIYMASTLGGSCRVFNAQVKHPECIVGSLGDIEHLRELLQDGYDVDAGELIWMTDTTPHESLPVASRAFRQFFRVVSSSVSVWYAAHSTKNRLGIEPPERVLIIEEDKFNGRNLGMLVDYVQNLDAERIEKAKHAKEALHKSLQDASEFASAFVPDACGLGTELAAFNSMRHRLESWLAREEKSCLATAEQVHLKRLELEAATQRLAAAREQADEET